MAQPATLINSKLTGFSSLKMIADIRMKIIVVDLHIVYIETVMYMKLQLDRPMSTAAAMAETVANL